MFPVISNYVLQKCEDHNVLLSWIIFSILQPSYGFIEREDLKKFTFSFDAFFGSRKALAPGVRVHFTACKEMVGQYLHIFSRYLLLNIWIHYTTFQYCIIRFVYIASFWIITSLMRLPLMWKWPRVELRMLTLRYTKELSSKVILKRRWGTMTNVMFGLLHLHKYNSWPGFL